MTDIFARITPILLLISFGKYLSYKNIFRQTTIDELKTVVINVALSAVLFIAFVNMELKVSYYFVFILVFIMLVFFYMGGIVVSRTKAFSHPLTPFIVAGNSFGLLGIPLFITVFGSENVDKLSILGVGHEFFIWIVFITLIRMKFKGEKLSLGVAKDIIKSPLIISIAMGMVFNIGGLGMALQENPLLKGFYITLQYLSNLATPLILIIVGFGLKFNKKYMKDSIKLVLIRMVLNLTIGYAFKYLFFNNMIDNDIIFDYAYFTFLILPPPLSLPIFIGAFSTQEHEELTNNAVVLSTVISIGVFILFALRI